MKQLRTQNLGINFLPGASLEALGKSDPTKLWFVPSGFIIESWVDREGRDWYLKFSNGTALQGGVLASGAGNVTVTLFVPFVDTNYSLVIGYTGLYATNSSSNRYGQAGVKTTTSFFIRSRYNTSTSTDPCDWMACGRISQ